MRKLLLLIVFLFITSTAHAVTYYAVNAGGTWNTGATWSTVATKSALRVAGATAPTSADTCYLDDYSGNVTLNAGSVCLNIDMNTNGAYGGTLALGTQTLTVSGAATLKGTMTSTSGVISVVNGITLAGNTGVANATLTVPAGATANCLLTSGGFTWAGKLTFSYAGAVKLSGAWINTGLVTIGAATNINYNASSAETLTCNGGLTMSAATGTTPTATIVLAGGTFTNTSVVRYIYNPIIINPSYATVNTATNSFFSVYNNVTYSSTTPNAATNNFTIGTGSTLYINTPITINTPTGAYFTGWNNINFGTGGTYTLASALTCTGTLLMNVVNPTFSGSFDISCGTFSTQYPGTSTLTLVGGTTLYITSAMYINGFYQSATIGTGYTNTITSSSGTVNINYSGTSASQRVFATAFTNINATGSTIYNWYGGTLTGTTNIKNVTIANLSSGAGGFFIQ